MASPPHIVLFPFMAKGHTIPLIHLAHLLFKRGILLTIITTPSNSPFIHHSLSTTKATIIELPFPQNIPGIPTGIESTDNLPSISLLLPFVQATKHIQTHFEQALQSLTQVSCIISDGFLGWTRQSASKFDISRFVFYAMNHFAMAVSAVISRDRPHKDVASDDEPFSLSPFPWIQLTKNDLESPFKDPEPHGPHFDLVLEMVKTTSESQGLVVNSFYELESVYADYWNKEFGPRTWCVGPLCLAEPPNIEKESTLSECKSHTVLANEIDRPMSVWKQWLDQKHKEPVLYVAFGTQAQLSEEQLREIGIGLERSGVSFLWVVRSKESELGDKFEERVAGRGLVIREWIEQKEILKHERVKGFLSHCGWNSVMESICAGVPIVAWPMMAEQGLNAKMLVDELGIALRLGGGGGELVSSERVDEMVRELMLGEKGKMVREKAKEVKEGAIKAMNEGGSSWRMLDLLIEEVSKCKAVENKGNVL